MLSYWHTIRHIQWYQKCQKKQEYPSYCHIGIQSDIFNDTRNVKRNKNTPHIVILAYNQTHSMIPEMSKETRIPLILSYWHTIRHIQWYQKCQKKQEYPSYCHIGIQSDTFNDTRNVKRNKNTPHIVILAYNQSHSMIPEMSKETRIPLILSYWHTIRHIQWYQKCQKKQEYPSYCHIGITNQTHVNDIRNVKRNKNTPHIVILAYNQTHSMISEMSKETRIPLILSYWHTIRHIQWYQKCQKKQEYPSYCHIGITNQTHSMISEMSKETRIPLILSYWHTIRHIQWYQKCQKKQK